MTPASSVLRLRTQETQPGARGASCPGSGEPGAGSRQRVGPGAPLGAATLGTEPGSDFHPQEAPGLLRLCVPCGPEAPSAGFFLSVFCLAPLQPQTAGVEVTLWGDLVTARGWEGGLRGKGEA